MNENCAPECKIQRVLESLAQGEAIPHEDLLACETCAKAYWEQEEALVSLVHTQPFEGHPFQEELDLAKAASSLDKAPYPLPEYLRRYTESQLHTPEKKNSLVIKIQEKGLAIARALLDPRIFSESLSLTPVLRSVNPIQEESYVLFEEKVSRDQSFFYQIVKERNDEIYLSVRTEMSGSKIPFQQVTLKRDGRFLLSHRVSEDGGASFSGLKEGNYTIQFVNEEGSKEFDLIIL